MARKPNKADTLRLELQARILDLPEIDEKKSRFSGEPAFFVGTREVAHFHANKAIDIRVTRKKIRELALTKKFPQQQSSADWIEVPFKSEADLPAIVELLEVAAHANKNL